MELTSGGAGSTAKAFYVIRYSKVNNAWDQIAETYARTIDPETLVSDATKADPRFGPLSADPAKGGKPDILEAESAIQAERENVFKNPIRNTDKLGLKMPDFKATGDFPYYDIKTPIPTAFNTMESQANGIAKNIIDDFFNEKILNVGFVIDLKLLRGAEKTDFITTLNKVIPTDKSNHIFFINK
ncbi:MAG: hypothetical protein M3R17_01115 [Bacteroidota bacterium]|nr:hypothetical protein [Bacteroidota bacterium]